MHKDDWMTLMSRLGFSENTETFTTLLAAYSERGRFYHTTQHIEAMVLHWQGITHLLKDPDGVALAIWFHDAVYNPMSGSNEKDSAEWARKFILSQKGEDGALLSLANSVYDLIMATLHTNDTVVDASSDAAFLLDIDLSIFGATEDVFAEYEKNIRKEYKWVPYFIYKKKRAEVLEGFLKRERIFFTEYFFERWEVQARKNIQSVLMDLVK